MFCKNVCLNFFPIFRGKHMCRNLFFIRLQAYSLQLYWKRDSDKGLFRWILRNSQKHLLCIDSITNRFLINNTRFWLVKYYVTEIWYFIKKKNENNKNINILLKNNNNNNNKPKKKKKSIFKCIEAFFTLKSPHWPVM